MIFYKFVNGQAPSYMIELWNFKFQTHGHNLRSGCTQDTLAVQLLDYGIKLPVDIRKSQTLESFKSKVKNYLF